jgi:dihydrolipoamide dehydrogenase
MLERKADIAIIGGGSAGLAAYRAATKWTSKVVLIEGETWGTTCARVGCMPSKLLIAAAEAAHAVAEASAFGVKTSAPDVDGEAVMQRVRDERDRFVGFVLESVNRIDPDHRLEGRARFLDDHRLDVGGHTIVTAGRIVIATGSRPAVPAPFASLGDRLLVNDDIFEWNSLPGSVAVFGPGVIGLELGQALHRLGVRVRIFGIDGSIGPLTDPEVLDDARKAFASELQLAPRADVRAMLRTETGVDIRFADPADNERTESFDYVVAATGRRPNVDGLGLENTTLAIDERGVPVTDARTLRVGDSHVFVAGDATNDKPLLHEASDEGRIAGDNAGRYPRVRDGRRRSPLAVVFSDPQIAMVGASHKELAGQPFVTGEVSFENQGRSRVMLKNRGRLHVYADARTGRFLGAEMVGPRAEHISHLLAWAHQTELSIADMLAMPFYHPVIEEGLRTALRDACRQLADCRLKAA